MEVGIFFLSPTGRIRIKEIKQRREELPGCLKADWAVCMELVVSLLLEDLGTWQA